MTMTEYRTIEIDFEVHKRIELERRGFTETPNAVLRRLLKIDETVAVSKGSATDQRASNVHHRAPNTISTPFGGAPWSGKRVTLPHGTLVQMEYNGRQHSGSIQDGLWVVEGGQYKSPSAAAGGVARTRRGKPTSLDGWIYWRVKRPGDTEWIAIQQLRKD
jgi:hypothetical protein